MEYTYYSRPWQKLSNHSINVGVLCEEFNRNWCDKGISYNLGLLHDIGKYQKSFQEKLKGKNIRIEHSICGAKELINGNIFDNKNALITWALAYCIAGHHSGLPDGGMDTDNIDMSTLSARIKRPTEDYFDYKIETKLEKMDCTLFNKIINKDIYSYVFLIRMLYSSVVDADSLDSEKYYKEMERDKIVVEFKVLLEKLKSYERNFVKTSEISKTRSSLLQQALYSIQTNDNNKIMLLNLPTGAGKTLTSMRIALERLIEKGKERIIYVMPFTSIIEQNANVFKKIFGNETIVEHHSNFEINEEDEKYEFAIENWDAPIIITTNVQFFESIYSNKKSKLRKLHNIANSIIVFDEIHTLPLNYLKPCLEGIRFLTEYYNAEAILMTATMPNYNDYLSDNKKDKILNLVNYIPIEVFKRCEIIRLTEHLSIDSLIERLDGDKSSLIVVNKRKTAKDIFEKLKGKKSHLSTLMTANHRSDTISAIEKNLKNNEKITVVSTSLIEAGIDLDFDEVYRELAGLDSIIQCAGRCNREGKNKDAATIVFEFENESKRLKDKEFEWKKTFTLQAFEKYKDITQPEVIEEYYSKVKNTLETINEIKVSTCKKGQGISIPFKSYAEEFNFIKSNTKNIVIANDDKSKLLLKQLKIHYDRKTNRALQRYFVSVYEYELKNLMEQGILEQLDCGIYNLIDTSKNFYDTRTGLILIDKNNKYIL